MLNAITRAVSHSLASCELTFHVRQPIDIALAIRQHRDYELALESLGVRVHSLPEEPDLPDAVFVEDPLIVVEELAIITRPGAASRRNEADSLARAIAPFRPVHRITEPATLEGGDVLRIGWDIFVGLSTRTNQAGILQLSHALEPWGYNVRPIGVRGCLHLKSACCSLGDGRVLLNPEWLDTAVLSQYGLIDVPAEEPGAANVLRIGDTVVMPLAFPRTAALIRDLGLAVLALDIAELMKAEAAVTCSSIVFSTYS
jgi:dimethylargininase